MAVKKEKTKVAKFDDVEVERVGNKVILPDGMTYKSAREWLERKELEENQTVAPSEVFNCFPLDGAVQLQKALKEEFGWTQLLPNTSWWGSTPPSIVPVQIGPLSTDVVRIPWGKMSIPKLEGGVIATGAARKDGMWKFTLHASIRQKDKPTFDKIVEATRALVEKESIYKGKALRIESLASSQFDFTTGIPRFMTLSSLKEEDLILPEDVARDVRAAIFTIIRKADDAKRLGIKTKRAVLLAGQPGVGKTLTATIAAPLCVAEGRTMAYVTDAHILSDVIHFMKPYGRALIFVEDIDSVAGGEDRTEEINQLLNTIDGVDTKEADILFILTTNHPERLNAAFKRHGRSDWVINIPAPDALAAGRLIQRYGREVLDVTEDEALEVGRMLAEVNMIPASIEEVVQRAKLYALEAAGEDDVIAIQKADLMAAAKGVKEHLELMAKKVEEPKRLTPFGTMYLDRQLVSDLYAEDQNGTQVLDVIEEASLIDNIIRFAPAKQGG